MLKLMRVIILFLAFQHFFSENLFIYSLLIIVNQIIVFLGKNLIDFEIS